jgi:hypothetical protein
MSESPAPRITDEGLSVRLFNCRLDTATGEFRYVDMGHGYFVVLDWVPSHPADDVTVVVLRRLPAVPVASRRNRAAGGAF